MTLTELFRLVVSLSLLASILVIGIFSIKLLFRRKLSANWHYYIWFILLLRLLIPFTPPASFSVLNLIPHYRQTIDLPQRPGPGTQGATPTAIIDADEQTKTDGTNTNIISDDNSANTVSEPPAGNKKVHFPSAASVRAWFNWQKAAFAWIVGTIAISLYILLINGLLLLKIKKLPVCDSEDILTILHECESKLNVRSEVLVMYDDSLKSPALFGLIRPKIIISPEIVKNLSSEELRYIFLHELSHLKRRDLPVNALVLAIQAVYWFNPLIWYALYQMKQDCELSCDATALAAINPEDHRKYGQTIISLLQLLSKPRWAPGTLGFISKFNNRRIIMIATYKKTTIKWALAALAMILVVGCSAVNNPINPISPVNSINQTGSNQKQEDTAPARQGKETAADNRQDTGDQAASSSPSRENTMVYKNGQYGFTFALPGSWKGYSIITGKWEGTSVKSGQTTETGPMISIRHPQWTSKEPRQDIPLMVFTLDQWKSLQQAEFHVGAAPIPPGELGRNSAYVFALPARYNYAFPTGYKEVEKILENHPLQATQPAKTPDALAALLLNMMQLAKQGKVINSNFPAATTTIDTVEKSWGKADKTDWVAPAKGLYATYAGRNVVFGINKGEQVFEVRSFDSRLKGISLGKAKAVFGTPAYDSKSNGQEIIGYKAGSDFKIEMVFPQPTSSNPNPVMDHYNVLYPKGTVNSMADDPGRQW